MIRRAQAEALLKLAEALEECERNGIELRTGLEGETFASHSENYREDQLVSGFSAVHIRLAIAKLYPKSETAE